MGVFERMGSRMRRFNFPALCGAVAALAFAMTASADPTVFDQIGPSHEMRGSVSAGEAVLYDNTPTGAETVFNTTSVPRTGGADEALFNAPAALITSMQFGYLVDTGGPAAFDARIRFFDDINLAATGTAPQFLNQKGEITVPFTAQTAGAFITNSISLAALPGGGVNVTSNPITMGVPNVTDTYVQIDFFQPGTTTPVANNLVTYIFDGSGPNAGFTFASPTVGGTGAIADEVYWRDANANGIIGADEARGFATGRANFVLKLEGNVIPEPASLGLLGVASLALLRRRRA